MTREAALEPIRQHIAAEVENDVEKTMATVTEDFAYEVVAQKRTMHGRAEAAAFHRQWWNAFRLVEANILQHWLLADHVIVEVETVQERIGAGDPAAGQVTRGRAIAVFTVRDGKVASEVVYSNRRD